MPSGERTSPAAPASRELRREVARVSRRARAVLLAGAVLAAIAADLWYEVLSFWLFRLAGLRIWFPLFFLVAFAVFAAAAVGRTRRPRLSTLLDSRFALKERLSSAVRFERLPGVPADLREAQARETLRAVDFARLRSSFRFRPWGALAFLATGAAFIGWLMHRYPDSFIPRNVAFRQGRTVFMAVKRIAEGVEREDADSRGGEPGQDDAGHPRVALVPEVGSPKPDAPPGGPGTGDSPEAPPAKGGRGDRDATESRKKPPAHPETTAGRPAPAPDRRGEGKDARFGPGGGKGGTFARPVSIEETGGISSPTARPETGTAAGAADLRGPGAGPALPPMPFFRLLGGNAQPDALFDPQSLNIVLEAYPPKYREHLKTYLKALQTLREDRHGS